MQGADKLVDTLRTNLELYEEIKEKTMKLALADISVEFEELEESGELDKLNEIGEKEDDDTDFEVEKKVDLKVENSSKAKVKTKKLTAKQSKELER